MSDTFPTNDYGTSTRPPLTLHKVRCKLTLGGAIPSLVYCTTRNKYLSPLLGLIVQILNITFSPRPSKLHSEGVAMLADGAPSRLLRNFDYGFHNFRV